MTEASTAAGREGRADATIEFGADPLVAGFGSVRVRRLAPAVVEAVRRRLDRRDSLASVFRVSVATSDTPDDVLPAVAGRYWLSDDELVFVPLMPFGAGVQYSATFDPRPLTKTGEAMAIALSFSLPPRPVTPAAAVACVFPSGDLLPENLLRFRVRFSTAMARGDAASEIIVLDETGRPAADVLYRPPVELWDKDMRCLTVLLDPGRLKRGVGPNAQLGPPLVQGKRYTLLIGRGMRDPLGRPMQSDARKHFRVTAPVRDRVAPEAWALISPTAGSRRPLAVHFPAPLDRDLLAQAIRIESANGRRVAGRVRVGRGESTWAFRPATHWDQDDYRIRVRPWLEDVCGNTTMAAFDTPLRPGPPFDPAEDIVVPFRVGGAA